MSLPTFNRPVNGLNKQQFTSFIYDYKNKVVLESGSPSLIPPGASGEEVESHYKLIIEKVDKACDDGNYSYEFDFCLDRQENSWVSVQSCPTHDHFYTHRVMVSIADITTSRKQIESLKNKYTEILSLSKMIIHDVKNPLMAVLNVSRLLDMEIQAGKYANTESYIDIIDTVSKKALKMADKTSNLLIYISEKNEEEARPVALADELQAFVAEAKGKYPDRMIDIQVSDEAIGNEITGYRSYLRTIFEELLSNALKFSDAKLPIAFKLTREDNMLAVRCEDSGIGIPSLQASTMLQKLPATSRPGLNDEPGFGLGLPIIKKLTEKMDGMLNLESEEGEGTIATVKFPRLQMAEN